MTRRLGAIDIGTNSVLLTLADIGANSPGPIYREEHYRTSRLGQGVDRSGVLHPDAIERTLACLREYRSVCDHAAIHELLVCATSALREGQNSQLFLTEAATILGVNVAIVSGQREAELTFSGAISGIFEEGGATSSAQGVLAFDIGGGSTELIRGTQAGRVEDAVSLDVGSVRLTERAALSDPPTPAQLAHVRQMIEAALRQTLFHPEPGLPTLGIAGTCTTLLSISQGAQGQDAAEFSYDPALAHGALLTRNALTTAIEKLAGLTAHERLNIYGMEPGRADVIVTGGLLCLALFDFFNIDVCTVSDRGVRHGLIQERYRTLIAND